jgi:hypothetical protein
MLGPFLRSDETGRNVTKRLLVESGVVPGELRFFLMAMSLLLAYFSAKIVYIREGGPFTHESHVSY